MSTQHENAKIERTSRRRFLESSAAALGATMAAGLPLARSAHAAGDDTFRIGLIGCGGRGSGAAANAMNAGNESSFDVTLPASGTTISSAPSMEKCHGDHA